MFQGPVASAVRASPCWVGSQEVQTCREGKKKAVTNFGVAFSGVVISLLIKVAVSLWSDDVVAFAHRVPVFFMRSSSRRCFSSQ